MGIKDEEMKIFNTIKDGEWKNFNVLPFISFFYDGNYCYLNIGWLMICFQFDLKGNLHSK